MKYILPLIFLSLMSCQKEQNTSATQDVNHEEEFQSHHSGRFGVETTDSEKSEIHGGQSLIPEGKMVDGKFIKVVLNFDGICMLSLIPVEGSTYIERIGDVYKAQDDSSAKLCSIDQFEGEDGESLNCDNEKHIEYLLKQSCSK